MDRDRGTRIEGQGRRNGKIDMDRGTGTGKRNRDRYR